MTPVSRLLRVANLVMTAAFVFSVVVQYNDPDPVRWMLIYGLAAAACILHWRGHLRWPFPALVGVVALVWAISISPHVIGKTAFANMFQSFHMINEAVEEAREMGGLLILAVWMAVLTLFVFRTRTRQSD
jgi:hypothetical protein